MPTMPPSSSISSHADGAKLSAMQAMPGSESLRSGTLADWEAMRRYMHTLNDCVASGQAPDKALRNKDAWSKAVDGCITDVLECCPSAIQAAISSSDSALFSSIGLTLAYYMGLAHGCWNLAAPAGATAWAAAKC